MTVWTESVSGAALLQRDVSSGRVAHAYLFSGAAGRIPLDAALAFAAALMCPDAGCGVCEICTRVAHHAHPDVEVVEPAGMQLLVDQVRDVVRAASRRPVAGPRRVIVVEGADRMNPTAQNAFLKTLEEPPPSTTIVLLASNPEVLLETVRSRCREVVFRSPEAGRVAAMLVESGVEPGDAERWARAGGSLERATALATDPEVRKVRDELIERVLGGPSDPGEALEGAEWLAARTKELRERVAEAHSEHRAAYERWYAEPKRVADDRLRREQRRAEQDALDASIDDVSSVLRDLLVATLDPGAGLVNEDLRDAIVRRAEGLRPEAIIACLRDVEACRRRLRANTNVLLTLEEAFLALYRHLVGA